MDNNLFQTIFDKYSHSVEGSEYKYLCEVDAKKAFDVYALAYGAWLMQNVANASTEIIRTQPDVLKEFEKDNGIPKTE